MISLTPSHQDALIISNVSWAKGAARNAKARLPSHVLYDDLEGAALLGLTQAARRFDGRGAFRGWASVRIAGAIKDELRRSDWRIRRSAGLPNVLEDLITMDGLHSSQRSPEGVSELRDEVRWLLSLVEDRERRLVEMTIMSGMTLQEAAAILCISPSLACIQRKIALRAMKGAVA